MKLFFDSWNVHLEINSSTNLLARLRDDINGLRGLSVWSGRSLGSIDTASGASWGGSWFLSVLGHGLRVLARFSDRRGRGRGTGKRGSGTR